ncbi:unnamed protein product, partial [Timema podura]|nr:unnamed protein product [Timema podura]
FQEQKISVNDVEINYLKVGDGPKTILCLPGALGRVFFEPHYITITCLVLFATTGSIWSDFKPQLEKLNRSKFTLVAWDPP